MPGPGERIGDAYIRVHAHGEDLGDQIEAGLEDADLRGVAKKSAAEYDKGFAEGLRDSRSTEKEINKQLRRTIREVKVVGRETGNEYFKSIEVQLRKSARDSNVGAEMARRIREQFIRSGGDYNLIEEMLGDRKQVAALFDDSRRHMERLHVDAIRMNRQFNKEVQDGHRQTAAVFERHPYIVTLNRDMDRLSFTIGRVFGRGSRSEFLNFFGRVAGGLTALATLLTVKIPTGLIEFTRAMRFAFENAQEGASILTTIGKGFSSLGITLPRVAASFAAVGVAVGVLVFIIGPLISALSLLLGAITALAASLTFALAGALGGVIALLGPLVAGLGVVGLAFIGMGDKAKRMVKEAFKPLREEFQALGRVARQGLFSRLTETTEQLHGAFKGLRPLVREVSIAMADVGFGFAKAMNSPGFRQFRDAMATFLPGAVRKLGEIIRNTLGGLGGVFRAMIPFMQDVLDYLVRVTREFSNWANDDKGQRKITNFFERTKSSLKEVGGFIKEVGGLIGDLFSAGQGDGDDLFRSMRESIAEFRKFLKENPDALKNWFEDAKEFARALGNAAVAAGRIMDALDDEDSRNSITSFFTGLDSVLSGLATGIERIKQGFSGFKDFLSGNPFGAILDWAKMFDLGPAIEGAKRKVSEFFSGFNTTKTITLVATVVGGAVVSGFRSLWDGIRSKAASLRASISGSSLVQRVKGWWDDIRSKAANIRASIAGSSLVQRVKGWWDDIRNKAASIRASIPGSGTVQKVKGWWDDIRNKSARIRASISGSGAVQRLKGWWDSIRSKAVSIRASVSGALRSLLGLASGGILQGGVKVMASGGMLDGFGQRMAAGGFANSMQKYGFNNIIGESGREAIVPLDRPLSQVDPSVRALAAFAQGINTNGPGTQIGVDASGWTIVSNAEDPVAVAHKVIDRIADAASY